MSENPLPDFVNWPSFPFEGDLRVKKLIDPVDVEPPRHGEDATDCVACQTPDDSYIWVSERWRVRAMDRPTGLPIVLILESRSHLDLGDLPNLLAAELGVMTVRLERAVRSLDGVGRVHVNRWGDGSAHLHLWFLARPYGRLQLRGTFLSLWDDILPQTPENQWRENQALVAAWLAEFGGRALAEPPHIAWQSPSTIPVEPSAIAPDPEPASPSAAVEQSAAEQSALEHSAAEPSAADGPGGAAAGEAASGPGPANDPSAGVPVSEAGPTGAGTPEPGPRQGVAEDDGPPAGGGSDGESTTQGVNAESAPRANGQRGEAGPDAAQRTRTPGEVTTRDLTSREPGEVESDDRRRPSDQQGTEAGADAGDRPGPEIAGRAPRRAMPPLQPSADDPPGNTDRPTVDLRGHVGRS